MEIPAAPYRIENAECLFHPSDLTWEGHGVQQVFNPFLLARSDGEYRLYFTICDVEYKQALFYSDSTDLSQWSFPKPLLTSESPVLAPYRFDRVGNCSLAALSEGYRIWFFGLRKHQRRIYTAFSNDGISFEEVKEVISPGSCFPYDGYYAYNPFVLRLETEYRIWYTGWERYHPEYAKDLRILTARSDDGIQFENFQLTIDQNQIPPYDRWGARLPGCVLWNPHKKWELFYIGYDDHKVARLLFAQSKDGINWFNHVILAEPSQFHEATSLYSPMVHRKLDGKDSIWFTIQRPSGAWELWQGQLHCT
jgi:predicted GH43/DUF377 family glycosyl hydrolase